MPTVSTTPQGDADFTVDQCCFPCWDTLPDDIILQIFSFLGASSLHTASQVCKAWLRVAYDEFLWKELFYRHWHIDRSIPMAPGKHSWIQEYKRLFYHIPSVESEVLKQHGDQVLHVSFSHNGKMFATSSKDGFIRVWDTAYPTSLKFKADMRKFTWKYTQYSQFNESDTLLLVSGVHFGSLSTSGEIAVFSLEGEFVMQSRVMNKPYDVFGTWYNDCYLLSGNLHWTGHLNSCSVLFYNKAYQETMSEEESVVKRLFRFANTNASSIRTILVSNCLTEEAGPEQDMQTKTTGDGKSSSMEEKPESKNVSPPSIISPASPAVEPTSEVDTSETEVTKDSRRPMKRVQSIRVFENGCFCTKLLELDEDESGDRLNGTIEYSDAYRQAESSLLSQGCSASLNEEEKEEGRLVPVSSSSDMEVEPKGEKKRGSKREIKRTKRDDDSIDDNDEDTVQYSLTGRGSDRDNGAEIITYKRVDSVVSMLDLTVADQRVQHIENIDQLSSTDQQPSSMFSLGLNNAMDTMMSVDMSEVSLDQIAPGSFCCVDYSKDKTSSDRVNVTGGAGVSKGDLARSSSHRDSGATTVVPPGCDREGHKRNRSEISLSSKLQMEIPSQSESAGSSSSSMSSTVASQPVCDKYLIFSKGSETYTPHQIGIKRIKPLKAFSTDGRRLLPNVADTLQLAAVGGQQAAGQQAGGQQVGGQQAGGQQNGGQVAAGQQGGGQGQPVVIDYDEVDHLIDMHGHIIGMALSPDHRYLYVNSRPWPKDYYIENPLYPPPIAQEIDIHVIDLQRMKEVGTMHRSHKAYTSNDECFFIFLDVCDKYVASGAEDKHGYLWDRHYGLCLKKYPHTDVVNSVAFNPQDPEVLVTVSDDFSIRIWRSLSRQKEVVKAYDKEHIIRMKHVRAIMQNPLEDSDSTDTTSDK